MHLAGLTSNIAQVTAQARTAARMVEPVASPSSIRMTVRAATSGGAQKQAQAARVPSRPDFEVGLDGEELTEKFDQAWQIGDSGGPDCDAHCFRCKRRLGVVEHEGAHR